MNQNFFDDMAKMAGGAFQNAEGIRKQMENIIKEKFTECTKSMNIAHRDELQELRSLIATLEARIAAIETKTADDK